jgi:RecB family exonuclease
MEIENDDVHDDHKYDGPGYVKLSPTRIVTALSCPRKYKLRYIDGLEPAKMPSMLAFGRAIHAAIAAAYARQNAPLDTTEVSERFAAHFKFLDEQGISYKEKESYEDLEAKGRALAALWWETYRDDVLSAKVLSLESAIGHDVEVGLAIHGYPDVIEERDGLVYIGDHKTVAGWGESDEILMAKSVQLTMYAYLCRQVHGRLPDKLYITVLKKTKEPQVFRYFTERTAAEVDALEDYVRGIADLIRFHEENDKYPKNYSRECSWCGFNALCWELEGAREMFVSREERKEREKKREAAIGDAIIAGVDPKYDGDERARKLAVAGHVIDALDDE